MSYAAIVGHGRAKATLKGALARDAVHHAYLIHGPRGVGKSTLATSFAAALTCRAPIEGDACGVCPQCQQLSQDAQPNVRLLGDGSSAIPVDTIRELVRWVGLKTVGGGRRVVILRGAEHMNDSAANALLKTLEEPPPASTFILTTTGLHSLLPTIRSRCQAVGLSPISPEAVTAFLVGRGVEAETAEGLARLSGGAIGQALSLTEDALELRGQILDRILACDGASVITLFKDAEGDGRDGDWLTHFLPILESLLRDALVLKLAPGGAIVNRDRRGEIEAWAARRSLGTLYARQKDLTRARDELRLHINGRVVLERLYLGLGGSSPQPTP